MTQRNIEITYPVRMPYSPCLKNCHWNYFTQNVYLIPPQCFDSSSSTHTKTESSFFLNRDNSVSNNRQKTLVFMITRSTQFFRTGLKAKSKVRQYFWTNRFKFAKWLIRLIIDQNLALNCELVYLIVQLCFVLNNSLNVWMLPKSLLMWVSLHFVQIWK